MYLCAKKDSVILKLKLIIGDWIVNKWENQINNLNFWWGFSRTMFSYSNIKLLQDVQNYNYLDGFGTLYIENNQKDVVNNEPRLFHNSPLLYIIII